MTFLCRHNVKLESITKSKCKKPDIHRLHFITVKQKCMLIDQSIIITQAIPLKQTFADKFYCLIVSIVHQTI